MSDSKSRIHINGEQKGRAPVADYNEINVMELEDTKRAKMEFFVAKKVGEHLASTYPNRQWGVEVDTDNGIVVITCPSVSLTKGYHLHLNQSNIHDLQLRASKAAGEILERHNVSRGKNVDPLSFDHMPQNLRGDVITKDSNPEKY